MHDSTRPRINLPGESAATDHQRLAFAALIGGNMCLAFGPWLVRLANVGPIAAGFWRLALAVPMLFLLACVMRQPVPRLSARLWALLALGGLFFAADLASWHVGILRTRLANATLFGNSTSFIFPLYSFIMMRRMPGRYQIVALTLAALGVGMLMGRSYELSPKNLVGDLFCLGAGCLYTGYLVAVERARGVLQPLPTLLVSTLAGILPLLILATLLGERIVPHAWGPLLLLALGSQVVGQGLMVYAIGHLPPVVVGLGLLTQPVIAATIGWLAYGERLGVADFVGAAGIAVALVLVRRAD
jgi:drug/metabolite transporter (DMT)-like permease